MIRMQGIRKEYHMGDSVLAALDGVELTAPVRRGQVVLADVCGTGVDVVATRDL